MNKVFSAHDADFFTVPDGTSVNPFLNALAVGDDDIPGNSTNSTNSSANSSPVALPDGSARRLTDPGALSIAAGHIAPGTRSAIHVHPHIQQITILLAGALRVHMKDPTSELRYTLTLEAGVDTGEPISATVAAAGTFVQFDATDQEVGARVLYVCSPAYLFAPGDTDEAQRFDDAVVVGDDWDALAATGWAPAVLRRRSHSKAARRRALAHRLLQKAPPLDA